MRATEWPCRSRVLRLMGLWSGRHDVGLVVLDSLPQQHLRRHRRRRVRERWWARWRGEYWLRVVEWMDREARQEAAWHVAEPRPRPEHLARDGRVFVSRGWGKS